jgi:hypothetical protein
LHRNQLFIMTDSSVELRIRGAHLHPETLKASDLAQILLCLEKAIAITADVRPTEDEPEPVVVSLTAIRDGSAGLGLTVSPAVWGAVVMICVSIADREFRHLPRNAQAKLAELSRLFVKQGWEGEFTGHALRRAVISASNPVPEPEASRLRGTTALVGKCIRVGGVEPSVQIRPAQGGKLITVQVSHKLVKELGDRLYETVALEGEAVWDSESWEIIEFRAARVLPYRSGDVMAAFRELATVSANAWDGVDAEEYVRKSRSEDSEGV